MVSRSPKQLTPPATTAASSTPSVSSSVASNASRPGAEATNRRKRSIMSDCLLPLDVPRAQLGPEALASLVASLLPGRLVGVGGPVEREYDHFAQGRPRRIGRIPLDHDDLVGLAALDRLDQRGTIGDREAVDLDDPIADPQAG